MKVLQSFVGGRWREGLNEQSDVNPAHPSEIVATVQLADARLAGEAAEAASRAFPSWRSTPAPKRGEILRKAADLLEQRVNQIAQDFTREEGTAIPETTGEIIRAVAMLRY